MATLEQCIVHYKNARNAVKQNNASIAKRELYSFLSIIAEAAQSSISLDKAIFENIFNRYFPVYTELKKSGITGTVKNALCISITSVFGTGRKIKDIPVMPPVKISTDDDKPAFVPPPPPIIPPVEIPVQLSDDTEPIEGGTKEKKDEVTSDKATGNGSKDAVVDNGSFKGNAAKDRNFRPTTFEDFIGQQQAVEDLKIMVEAAKAREDSNIEKEGGVFFVGPSGVGKTTLARIVAYQLNITDDKRFIEYGGATFRNSQESVKQFEEMMEDISKENQPVLIFIDEIHAATPKVIDLLLKVLEDRFYRKPDRTILRLPDFTFISATTDPDKLPLTFKTRCRKIELFDYTDDEWKKIILQKFNKINLTITTDAVNEIVPRTRSSVRVVQDYARELDDMNTTIFKDGVIDKRRIIEFFGRKRIDRFGVHYTEYRILSALTDARNLTLAEENLCSKVNITLGTFQSEHKPFLMRAGFIESSTQGIKLTVKALEYIKALKDANGNEEADNTDTQKPEATMATTVEDGAISGKTAEVTAEAVLELLTGKYSKVTVEKNILCDDLDASLDAINAIIVTLSNERLVNIRPLGVIATIDAYKKLNKPFNPLD